MIPFIAFSQGVRNTFRWSGRTNRTEYWWYVLLGWLAYFGCMILVGLLSAPVGAGTPDWLSVIFAPVSLGVFWSMLSATIRRLHDSNHSGAWTWLLLVKLVGWIAMVVFTCMPSDPEVNRFGPPSEPPWDA